MFKMKKMIRENIELEPVGTMEEEAEKYKLKKEKDN